MYLLNATTNIEWVLDKTSSVIVQTDLAVVTNTPSDEFSYVLSNNLIAPDENTQGLVTYSFIPNEEGLWEIELVKGSAETYTTLSKAMFYVFTNDLEVEPLSYSDGNLVIPGQ